MLQISLRQLLILTAAIALAIVSLKYASPFWQGLIGLVALLSLVAAIVAAIFDRGPRQAFAIGFVVAMLIYGVLIATGHHVSGGGEEYNAELRASEGQLPTTILLDHVHKLFAHAVTIDRMSGRVVSDAEAQQIMSSWSTASSGPMSSGPPISNELAREGVFTPIGHFWWALLLGTISGSFARFAYVRRSKEQSASHSE